MMKLKIVFLLLLTSHLALSQVGQTAADVLIDVASSTLPETQALAATLLHQKDIAEYSENIAKKTTAIAVLKEAELASLKESPQRLEATGAWQFTLAAIEQIISVNGETIALANQDPERYDLSIDVLPQLLTDVTNTYIDLQELLKNDDDHLMSAPDRFELIKRANVKLARILEFSIAFNRLMKLAPLANGSLNSNITYDFTDPMAEIDTLIDALIVE